MALARLYSPLTSIASARPCDLLAFTDSQLRTVWTAAYNVPAEKRRVFIERVVARLQLHRGFTDADLDDAVRAALTGLIQSAA